MTQEREAYRVRHPFEPSLFVWFVESWKPATSESGTSIGKIASRVIHFAQYRDPMTKQDAELLAREVGGTVEPVRPNRDPSVDDASGTDSIQQHDDTEAPTCCLRECVGVPRFRLNGLKHFCEPHYQELFVMRAPKPGEAFSWKTEAIEPRDFAEALSWR